MLDVEALRGKIKESGMTITAISRKMQISRATFYNKLNGKSEFRVLEVMRLGHILNLSSEEKKRIFFSRIVECNSTIRLKEQ